MQEYKIKKVCRIIKINRSSYYQKRKDKSNSEKTELELRIIYLFRKHKRTKGKRQIYGILNKGKDKADKVGLPKIARILRDNNLIAKGGARKRYRPKPEIELVIPKYNLIKDKFRVKRLNTLLCADICQLRYKGGWLYISGIMDVANREIVGYHIATHMRKEIVIESIQMAADKYKYNKRTVFHSDNGSQYRANATKELLTSMGIRLSRSRPGKPMDNQPIESFWKTLRRELDDISKLSFDKARMIIVEYITMNYNSERLHSSLEYLSPLEVRKLKMIA